MTNETSYRIEAQIDFCGAIEEIRIGWVAEDDVAAMRQEIRNWARTGSTVTINVIPND